MPRKSGASTVTADPSGDVSMASEPPTVSSPKQTKDQPREGPKPSGKKKEKDAQDKSHSHTQQQGDVISLDDLLLPRSIIQRLAKGVLPPNTSLQRDAVLALTKSATVFISLLASTANEMTDRKTIQSGDVLKALREIEMDSFVGKDGRVEREVDVWEREIRGKRRGYRERVKARESTGTATAGAGDTTLGDTTLGSVDVDADVSQARMMEDEEHEHKRIRIDLEGDARDGSAGPITHGTGKLKLNGGEGGGLDEPEIEEADDAEESDDQDDEDEDEEQEEEADETQDVDDSIDIDHDEEVARRKNATLAPDGRVEVAGSDDEDGDSD